MTIEIDGTKKEFNVDTGSPVTILPPHEEILNEKKLLPLTRKYRDVNKSDIKFTGKSTAETENRGIR